MQVKQLARKGRSLLIEWEDEEGRQRSYVPLGSVYDKQGQTFCDCVAVGIPYGVPWKEIAHLYPTIDGVAFQQELRRLGIWTLDDLDRTAEANSAIRQIGGEFTVGEVKKFAAEYLHGGAHE